MMHSAASTRRAKGRGLLGQARLIAFLFSIDYRRYPIVSCLVTGSWLSLA